MMSEKILKKNWKILKLYEIATVERGKFSARPRNDPQYYGGNIPFLQTGDISSSNGIVTSYSQTLNEKGLAVSRLFEKGTLLITIAANIGDVAEVSFDFSCPDSLVAITPQKNISSLWLRYFLTSKKQFFKSQATQNAQANINLNTIRPIKILLPPLPEQKAIADLLSTWDKAIEKSERLIRVKETQLRQMSRWLLLGHKRLGNQKNELADGHFFKYPSDWTLVKIGKVAKEVSARNGGDSSAIPQIMLKRVQ